jgi:Pyruvate kinase, alpha/beta domain
MIGVIVLPGCAVHTHIVCAKGSHTYQRPFTQTISPFSHLNDRSRFFHHLFIYLFYKHFIISPQSVAEASKNLSAACIIVLSETGLTAMNISKFRPRIPIVTIVPNAKAGRLLQVGVESVS